MPNQYFSWRKKFYQIFQQYKFKIEVVIYQRWYIDIIKFVNNREKNIVVGSGNSIRSSQSVFSNMSGSREEINIKITFRFVK